MSRCLKCRNKKDETKYRKGSQAEGDQRSQTGTWEAGNVAMAGVGRADGEEG
jgi:hypothetical protein